MAVLHAVPSVRDMPPVPERFVVTGQTYDWNWAHAQRYQVRYTTNLHLAVKITPVC